MVNYAFSLMVKRTALNTNRKHSHTEMLIMNACLNWREAVLFI